METLLWTGAILLIVIGLFGLIIPVLPGTLIMFSGFLLAAWIGNFQLVSVFTIFIIGFLTLVSIAVDLLAASFGVKKLGASKEAFFGAAVGTVVGLFFGIVGLIVGPFLGAAAGEYMSNQDINKAGKVGVGAWLGFMIGTAIKLALAFGMIGIFIMAYFL